MSHLAQLDHRYVWHPFTQMREWLQQEPIVIVRGEGAVLRDARGRKYLDANSSIWTNLHGHNHPKINRAIQRQLKKIAHSSALGLANEPASLLAARLVEAVNPKATGREDGEIPLSSQKKRGKEDFARQTPARGRAVLAKVFFSDDGSTAMEVALKLAYEFARRSGRSRKPRFLSLQRAYHGDTVGAASLGHLELFQNAYSGLLFKSDAVMSPYCYRCRFNRAKPERADARDYRRCRWECLNLLEEKFSVQRRKGNPYAAMVVEPLMQGAAGMIPQPRGWLRRAAEIVHGDGAQLIADEVMTGFGRTGSVVPEKEKSGNAPLPLFSSAPFPLFACQHEGVQPEFLALAKGLTGGYLPMAATLTTEAVFDAFLGSDSELKTFYHGHSFTGNQLGAVSGLASLNLLQGPQSIRDRQRLERTLHETLSGLWRLPKVGDIRQVGLIAGVELVKNWRTREPFDARERAGWRVCEAMKRQGVLTRPVGNVVVLMPPYCTTPAQAARMVEALAAAIKETLENRAR